MAAQMGKKSLKPLKKQDKTIGIIDTYLFTAVPKTTLLLLFSFLMFSCGDRPPVNEQYLKSEGYKQFSKSQQNEYSTRLRNRRSLKKYLADLSDCNLGENLKFPIQFDSSTLNKEQDSCNEVSRTINRNFYHKSIGYTDWKDIIIRWILIQKESVYTDAELVAATYRGDTLLSFQTVGIFRQNLQQQFSTNITVVEEDDHLLIQAVMDRGIKYPFEQNNIIETVFEIDTAGEIAEQNDRTISYQSLPKFLEELNRCHQGKQYELPVEFNKVAFSSKGISCENISNKYNTNFSAQSFGYITFKNIIVRLFDMRSSSHTENHLMIAAAYKDSESVSFQTVGKFHSYSPNFITDIDISSNVKIHQEGDSMYITSVIMRDRSFPIVQKDSLAANYVMSTDGNIIEI